MYGTPVSWLGKALGAVPKIASQVAVSLAATAPIAWLTHVCPRLSDIFRTRATRRALIEAATAVFAEHGFAAGSIRAITRKAKANQAAITYHFGGKEGLYAEVLRSAVAALGERGLDDASVEALPREEALRLLLRQLLAPLARRDRLGRHVRIFGWGRLRPSPRFEDLMAR